MDLLRQDFEKRLAVLYRPKDRPWVEHRVRQELSTIQTHGQEEVFYEAHRAVQLLRDQGVTCRLIGAGCSSLVSYLMQLSEVDPMEYGLPYERFLKSNPSRKIQFHFVAHLQLDEFEDGVSSIQKRFSSGTISIQQATAVEAMNSFVAKEIHRTDPDFQLNSISLNDKATFDALWSGKVKEIDLRRFLSTIKPQSLTDIAAVTAIQILEVHEPGMSDKFIHPEQKSSQGSSENWLVEQTTQETRGIILFQEQIMLILYRVADIPLADAYSFIKAACKQQWEQVALIREWFISEAIGNGMNEPGALTLFEKLRHAATRAVCKAHHLSEALTTYRTAFLKTHFPREFSRTLQIIQRSGLDEHHGEKSDQGYEAC